MSSEAPRRTREGASKSRMGCLTCKARRVKCDEEKPTCRRCTRADRICEYGDTVEPPKHSRHVVTVYLPPGATVQTQPSPIENTAALSSFHGNLATKLDGQFDSTSKFWSRLVMQLAQTEPAVRHAVSAISMVHEAVERSMSNPTPGLIILDPIAMKEWNSAMKCLFKRIETHPNSTFVPLVCCLLFTCFEFAKGSVDSAFIHVESGLRIINTARRSKNTTHLELMDIETYVVPVFSRLNSLCTLFGRVTPPAYSASVRPDNAPITDLADARQQLFEILDVALRFIRSAGEKTHFYGLHPEDLIAQVKLQSRLERWRQKFEEFLASIETAHRKLSEEAIIILLLNYKVVFIWLSVCTYDEETAVDRHDIDFKELVQYADRIVELRSTELRPDLLSFDMQLIAPLYYTAVKCRQPVLRRRALHLLQRAPRREGLWNAHHALKTAQRIIELEEAQSNEEGLPVESRLLHGVKHPSGWARVYNVGDMPAEHRTFEGNVIPHPEQPGTIEIIFQTKPWGAKGPFHDVVEYIVL